MDHQRRVSDLAVQPGPAYASSRSRRDFLAYASAVGAAALLGLPRIASAEPPPETTTLRLVRTRSICQVPQYVAKELLRGEGFTDVQYLEREGSVGNYEALASGEAQISMTFVTPLLTRIDAGDPIVMLAGGHVGCFELYATDRVRAIRDLKGKTVAVHELGGAEHLFLASMLAYVGLNPRNDVTWVTYSPRDSIRMLAEKKIDAFLPFPTVNFELREKKIGHVVVNSALDRPWSQYFCCMISGNKEFVQKYPVATKRAVRAILKAADLCASEPDRAARLLVDGGFSNRVDYARQLLRDIPYGRWRNYHPEDTVRFYALRLHEVGMLKSDPKKLIAQGTDWRFLNELKKELKT